MSEFQSQLFKAGAGTGKTTALVDKVYRLFSDQEFQQREGREPRLIVCTFTRKASQELKERLFKKAVEASGESAQRFLHYIQSPSLYISTIDGILNLFLRRYGHRWELSPDFQIDHGRSDERFFDSMADEFIFEKHFSLLKKLPYPYLKQLLIFYFKCRLKYGAMSFYDRADFEEFQKERSAFDSLKDLLKKPKDLPRDFSEIKHYFQIHQSSLGDFLNNDKDIEKFKGIFKKEESFNPDLFVPLFEELDQAGKDFFSSFLEKKKKESELGIEDLSLFSLALLREREKTARDFSREWDYWLIDEYQDTSWIQEQILREITGFKNVFCVGDPGQSIYFFRGADPKVFERREKALEGRLNTLDINHRSTAELISFYNDFFPTKKVFLKMKAGGKNSESDQDFLKEGKASVRLLTYKKQDKKSAYKEKVFQALFHYIEELQRENFSKTDKIAILSSKNKDVEEAADYLRNKGLNIMLYSSKSFARKRLILDSLFLLKFIINPHDNDNLKALLRTPYFRIPDQELVNMSHKHNSLSKAEQLQISFWSFLHKSCSDHVCFQSLEKCLELKKEQGLVKSFEKTLMGCGLMDLSYYQDATGSSESGLWKLLSILNEQGLSALEHFYSLMEEEEEEESYAVEPPSCDGGASIELMSIHKSKGLQFKHVILLDFSIDQSSGKSEKKSFAYNERKGKMAFAVPKGSRDGSKVKSLGHILYDHEQKEETLRERDRLFYVAMTRAEKSLALFVPQTAPEKNSWLERQSGFFTKFENPKLLKLIPREKSQSPIWNFNKGIYQGDFYFLSVQSCEFICKIKSSFHPGSPIGKGATALKSAVFEEKMTVFDEMLDDQKANSQLAVVHKIRDQLRLRKSYEELKKPGNQLLVKSSHHFVEDLLKEKSSQKGVQAPPNPFVLQKTQNILLKRHLGNQLHDFLQRVSYQSFDQVRPLIENSLLSPEEKQKIQQAFIYLNQLEEPPMKDFLKKGFSEWPFKLQKENVILQGQIDLWFRDPEGVIHVCDYKSSSPQTSHAKHQLIFYSGVLKDMYQAEQIRMYEVYPFEKKVISSLYNESQAELFNSWLKQLKKA